MEGYLEVKIPSRAKRGFMPWKAWQTEWCELEQSLSKGSGANLKLKTSKASSSVSCIFLPSDSTICRTESQTRKYAFGIFTTGKNKKALIYLSGSCETDSQNWMSAIRKKLHIAPYLPTNQTSFHVSLIDNRHSRDAGIAGLYGVVHCTHKAIAICDPCTGDVKFMWKWHQFHQFHLQAAIHSEDKSKICVMHTSKNFPSGVGQLLLFCDRAAQLTEYLISRGTLPLSRAVNMSRLSRSEGDLFSHSTENDISHFQSNCGSDDSGLRGSTGSDNFSENDFIGKVDTPLDLLLKTPGGSEANLNSFPDSENVLDRRESGIYEEIYERPADTSTKIATEHIYENPLDLILTSDKNGIPPPLPQRNGRNMSRGVLTLRPDRVVLSSYKRRCSTLPARDLTRFSAKAIPDYEDYVIMSPTRKAEPIVQKTIDESIYLPMKPAILKSLV